MSLAITSALLNALNQIPAMRKGVYSRFSIILYNLVKKYYGDSLNVELVHTAEDIAVISLNGFILNPYAGITLKQVIFEGETPEEALDTFLEVEPPNFPEVMVFLDIFSVLLKDLYNSTPITPEMAVVNQSQFHQKFLAVDIALRDCSRVDGAVLSTEKAYPKGPVTKKVWSNRTKNWRALPYLVPAVKPTMYKTKYRLPNVAGVDYSVTPVIFGNGILAEFFTCVGDSTTTTTGANTAGSSGTSTTNTAVDYINKKMPGFLESAVANGFDTKNSLEFIKENVMDTSQKRNYVDLPDTPDLTSHFVKAPLMTEGEFKPLADITALELLSRYGDIAASGLLSITKGDDIYCHIYSKTVNTITINHNALIGTLGILIDEKTACVSTEEDDTNFNFTLGR